MENTFFNVNDVKQLITAAKKNNVEITISWYEDHSFITISPLMELNANDDSAVQAERNTCPPKEKDNSHSITVDVKRIDTVLDDLCRGIIDTVLDAMCNVEFADEERANYVLSYMHYVLHMNGTVVSDKFFDYLEKTYDGDEYVVWRADECGEANGDFLNVKLIKCSNGKYKLDKSTIPQPSPILWM